MGHGEVFGRDDELAAVAEFVREAAASPVALVIVGEAGIGKTTLWREAVACAERSSFRVLTCSPTEAETSLSFAGMADLLNDVLDDVLSDVPAPQAAALEVALRRLDTERPPDQLSVRSGFLNALRALSKGSALMVGIDDVQWLDAPSRLALAFALRRLRDERVAFVVARRGEATEELPLGLDRAHAGLRVKRLDVEPLSLGAVHGLLRSRLGSSFPRPVLRKIHEVSGGNPFYALELGRDLSHRPRERRPDEPIHLPRTLDSLVRDRLECLRPDTGDVLLGASALAEPAIDVLDRAYTRRRVRAALEEATAAGVVTMNLQGVTFSHPLLASACYGSATVDRRRRTHLLLARAVEDPEERARHLALSAEGADEEVAAALEDAALHASARGAPETGAELAELALAHTPTEPSAVVVRRELQAGDYHLMSGDARSARTWFQAALGRAAPGPERADALFRLADAEDDSDTTAELAEQALAESLADPARSVRIHRLLAYAHTADGARGRLAHARKALELAELVGDDELLVSALAITAEREYAVGRVDLAGELLERALELEPRTAVRLIDSPRITAARRLQHLGRDDEARGLFAELLGDADDRGDEWARLRILWNLSWLEVGVGAFEEAARHADEGFELADAADVNVQRFLVAKARIAAYLGEVDKARAAAGRVLSAVTRAWDLDRELHAVLGFLELSLGDLRSADRHLREIPASIRGSVPPHVTGWANPIEVMIGLGDLQPARDHLASYEQLAGDYGVPLELAAAARCRGLLLAVEGDLPGARRAFDAALVQHAEVDNPFERARTLLCQGTALRRAKRLRESRRVLQEALDEFERLSAALWAEKARAELARIGGRTRSGELTASERRIAELVAEGRTNREVAAALFVTPKTVETRLSRMYAKLGIHSRTELARRMVDEQRVGIS
ncbi:MAG: helix-turn-helix transcriptional regulator [Gaiellaceae bacterium]